MPTSHLPVLVTVFILLTGSTAWGQDHHGHEDQPINPGLSQEAHIHGIAELFVVLEKQQLDIELHSPAMNLLGFEHQASGAKEQAKINSVKAALEEAHRLFQLGSAQCQLIGHTVDLSNVVEIRAEHSKHHRDKEHTADHYDAHHPAKGHSDIKAHYRYRCKQPDQLRSLTTTIPIEFPGIDSVQAQWIVNGRQGAVTLDNSQRHLHFR